MDNKLKDEILSVVSEKINKLYPDTAGNELAKDWVGFSINVAIEVIEEYESRKPKLE